MNIIGEIEMLLNRIKNLRESVIQEYAQEKEQGIAPEDVTLATDITMGSDAAVPQNIDSITATILYNDGSSEEVTKVADDFPGGFIPHGIKAALLIRDMYPNAKDVLLKESRSKKKIPTLNESEWTDKLLKGYSTHLPPLYGALEVDLDYEPSIGEEGEYWTASGNYKGKNYSITAYTMEGAIMDFAKLLKKKGYKEHIAVSHPDPRLPRKYVDVSKVK
jgi:hypothetical protein